MFGNIKYYIVTHLVLSGVILLVVVGGIAGTSYIVSQGLDSSDNTKDGTSNSDKSSCANLVKIGKISVEKDPAGDPEAWLRFDYTNSGDEAINCQYAITFYDNQESIIRTIPDVEDTFRATSGQIYNGYSSTPYQAGMTAKATVQ